MCRTSRTTSGPHRVRSQARPSRVRVRVIGTVPVTGLAPVCCSVRADVAVRMGPKIDKDLKKMDDFAPLGISLPGYES